MGAGAPAACRPVGGVGGTGGGVAPWPPCSPSGGRPAAPYPAPLSLSAHSPMACALGWGCRAAPCAGCGLSGGGGGGGTRTAPPEAPTDPTRASALPERAILRASLAMLWSWAARLPYCSGSSFRAAPGRGACVALPGWCGLARRSQPGREQRGGGAGARGVWVQLRPPPGVAVPSGGGGTSPSPRGGGGPASPRLAGRGGSGGERWVRGVRAAVPRPPAPLGGLWPPSLSHFVSGAPPWGIHVRSGSRGGCERQARPGRPPAGQCGGGGGGGGSPRPGPRPCSPRAGLRVGRFVCAFLGAAVPLSVGSGMFFGANSQV